MEFKKDLYFLSNFYHSPIDVFMKEYPTVEHAYQARKTEDEGLRELIRNADTPGKAKRLGQNVPLREDWEKIKRMTMISLVYKKFNSSTELRDLLLGTGDQELVEGNTWHDNYWGDCSCSRCREIVGENHLGEALMTVRRILEARKED